MRHIRRFAGLQRKGMALLLVMFVAFASLVLLTALLASVAPRRVSVSGEAQASRVLAVADGMVDNVFNQVNAFPASLTSSALKTGLTNISTYYASNPTEAKNVARKYVMGLLLSGINGGKIYQPQAGTDPATLQADYGSYGLAQNAGAVIDGSGSIWDIEDNVATYLYRLDTQEYYAVWDNTLGRIAVVNGTGINGDILTQPIKNLTTGVIKAGGIAGSGWDPNFATDNRWIEMDVNAQYIDDGTNGKVQIRTSAYLLSSSNAGSIVRNILVEAPLKINALALGGLGPFKYAVGSGEDMQLYAGVTVESGHMASDGTIVHDGAAGEADVFANGVLTVTKDAEIYGNLETSGPAGDLPASGSITGATGYLSGQPALTLPDFVSGTDAAVKAIAQGGGSSSGAQTYSSSLINVKSGGQATYYVGGNVTISGSGSTINLYPLANSTPVDWYIDGSLNINSPTTINFGTPPGIIWVHGNVTISAGVTTVGSGTILATGQVIFYGATTCTGSTGKLAIISEVVGGKGIIVNKDHDVDAILYAPYSDIELDGGGTVFGSVVAGTGAVVNKGDNIVYDTGISASGAVLPPLPGVGSLSVSFSARTSYRSSWKEAVAAPVTNTNIATIAKLTLAFSSGS